MGLLIIGCQSAVVALQMNTTTNLLEGEYALSHRFQHVLAVCSTMPTHQLPNLDVHVHFLPMHKQIYVIAECILDSRANICQKIYYFDINHVQVDATTVSKFNQSLF